MAGFTQKIVDPLLKQGIARLEEAQKTQDVTARTDDIINASYKNDLDFLDATKKILPRKLKAAAAMFVGALAAAGGIMAATSLVAAVAGTTGFAIPLAVAGVAVFGGGLGVFSKAQSDQNKLAHARGVVSRMAEGTIRNLVKVFPAETAKASKLASYLKSKFNPAASDNAPDAAAIAPAVIIASTILTRRF